MRRADFSYPLPPELIAQRPLPERTASRLLALDGGDGTLRDHRFTDLPTLLRPGDLLVVNDTRVLPARVEGRKASGGACELLLERIIGPRRFLAQARASKGLKRAAASLLRTAPERSSPCATANSTNLSSTARCSATSRRTAACRCRPTSALPGRGAIASVTRRSTPRRPARWPRRPPAHFDPPMLERLAAAGVGIARLSCMSARGPSSRSNGRTRCASAARGTIVCAAETVAPLVAARRNGGRVVAVGTTVVRPWKPAAAGAAGVLAPMEGETACSSFRPPVPCGGRAW